MLKRKTLSAGAGMDIGDPFRGGLLAMHINVNFLRRTKTFSPRAKRLQMTFRAQRQFRYVAGDVRVNIFARGWTYGRGQPLSLTLSLGEIPWFDEKGEIRRFDWTENAFFLCAQYELPGYGFLFSQSQCRISPFSSNHGISPNDSVNDSG